MQDAPIFVLHYEEQITEIDCEAIQSYFHQMNHWFFFHLENEFLYMATKTTYYDNKSTVIDKSVHRLQHLSHYWVQPQCVFALSKKL